MEPIHINNYNDLKAHINALKIKKSIQEEKFSASFAKLRRVFNLGYLFKKTTDLVPINNKNGNLSKTGLNVGSEFLIDQLWGRHKSIGSFVSAFAVRRISHLLINNSNRIISLFKNTKNKLIG